MTEIDSTIWNNQKLEGVLVSPSNDDSAGNLNQNNSSKTVFVMMSGGVDSSVAALKLKQEGYNVVGVFMKCWSIQALDELGVDRNLYGCFWEQDSQDAALVAAKLEIPFFVWDFEEEYKNRVVEYMLKSYQAGLTPNPDVMCNSVIKFGLFLKNAKKLGADFVATGHYAKLIQNGEFKMENYSNNSNLKNNLQKKSLGKAITNSENNLEVELHRGDDSNKDQSYFLWRIPREELNMMLFPIGDFATKAEVRKLASENNLITATKKDSQGLCFIGTTPLRELLLQSLGEKKGDIVSLDGKVLGQHLGAYLYTVGQREKLGLGGGPWFVKKVDVDKNQVIVAHGDEVEVLDNQYCLVSDFNWLISDNLIQQILNNKMENGFKLSAQVRYHQKAVKCYLEKEENGKYKVIFSELVRAIAPGQSIVFYHDDHMLGGAVIQTN
jgi:tRNA-uridine 2-sulfurtransferase